MASQNASTLEWLFETGRLRLARSDLFTSPPPSLPADLSWDRVEGMLLGLAVGDALGRPAEALSPRGRYERFGEIRDYLPNPRLDGARVGLPSDDTQLAFWTLEVLLAESRLDPAELARRFAGGNVFGVGQAMLRCLTNLQRGMPWYEAGVESSGNGALMRIAPVLVPHLRHPSVGLWADTVLAAVVTHNDEASTGSCLAFVAMLWDLLARDEPPPATWYLDRFLTVLRPLEGQARYRTRTVHPTYEGPLSDLIEREVGAAIESAAPVVVMCNRWRSGAYLLETVPSVLYILARYGQDPEEAVVRAVNDTLDNDTIAAIVGAAVGALHGRRALPQRWIDGLLGRTREDDDGRVFALIEQARERWFPELPGR